jgi:hypothetical protein
VKTKPTSSRYENLKNSKETKQVLSITVVNEVCANGATSQQSDDHAANKSNAQHFSQFEQTVYKTKKTHIHPLYLNVQTALFFKHNQTTTTKRTMLHNNFCIQRTTRKNRK